LAIVLAAYPDLNLYYVVAGIGTITNSKMLKQIKNHQPALHLIGCINEAKMAEQAPDINQIYA
jgi:hypothetical protein